MHMQITGSALRFLSMWEVSQPFMTKVVLLTTRQRQIWRLIALGQTLPQIKDSLGIEFKTAEVHRSRLMKTLGIHAKPDLVAAAIACGIVLPEEYKFLNEPEEISEAS